ncbi:uncharacterized protein J7T54_000358 [Emericellopsis cladophorae]|uniref:Rhodopsin domain-containing protein n=1 Tax=Emericellopsis cladophorae TaxID=2686198 RepID=A0A9P9XVM5_9HYPO|nr:uncharacterized protein J7T54_000358 [Emericellopsis cladophorae]KAI6778463.1 hypothetical protein J7T54_000358 [Emericellopsis cladophorae]
MGQDDRGAQILASLWSLTAAAAILLFLRLYCKLCRAKGLWWDDHVLILSWVSLTIAAAIQTYLVSLGFGQRMETISKEDLKTISLFTILFAIFAIIATTTSKSSFALTLYRITDASWMKYLLVFIIVTTNVSMNLVWIFGLAKCTPLKRVWDKDVQGTCWDLHKLVKFQLFAAYYSAILDFVLAGLPWQIIMGASIRRREMVGVAVAMSLGAVAGATGIVKAVMVVNMTSPDITYDRVDLTIWTFTEPAASIMAISIPMLRMLYQELKSSHNRTKYNQSNPQRSVVVSSNKAWKDSQEALRDSEDIIQIKSSSPDYSGILKTEEVRVHHERPSNVNGGNAIEMSPFGTR